MRDVVRTEDVHAELLADGAVGYLDVAGFSGSAADDFRQLLKAQLDQGVTRFVIDVRDDPGGFVDAALSIASEFIKDGPVYWEEYADGRQVPTNASGDGLATDPGIQVAVLMNGGSASASEILAGALQDSGRATLVGEQSFGKGTIQQWHLLSHESGGFRLSVAKWLTPDKRWIHGTGLTPDVPVSAGPRALARIRSSIVRWSCSRWALPPHQVRKPRRDPPRPAGALRRCRPRRSCRRGHPQAMGWPLRIGIAGPLPRWG